MRRRSRGTADQQRQLEALTLHLLRHVHHLIERWRDESRKADQISLLAPRSLEDLLARHHHAEIDHLEVVTLQHYTDDVLADVMHVALDGRHHDSAVAAARAGVFPLLDEGHEMGDGALHDAGALHHLRQEHFAGAEQVADDVHAVHQRPLDDLERPCRLEPRRLGVLYDVIVDALDERVLETLTNRELAPLVVLRALRAAALEARRGLEQPLGGLRAAIQHDVFARLAQRRIDLLVDSKLPGIDDSQVHAGGDGVVEEYRVHGLANRVVAAERERHVAHPATHERARQLGLEATRGLDESETVGVVLLDSGGDREDVGIEDDVVGRKPGTGSEQFVGAPADRYTPVDGVRLALLVERHHYRGGAVATELAGVTKEDLLAFLEADRVDHRLALHALQPGLDDRPLGGIDHHRHARDVRLRRDQVQEAHHRGFGVEHALVHVDIDHLRAARDLLPRDLESRSVIARFDELAKA